MCGHIKKVDTKYREWMREQSCAYCGVYIKNSTVPHHERILGGGGIGIKPPDTDLVPLCSYDHHVRHDQGAVTFWGQKTKARTKKFCRDLCDDYIKRYLEEK